MTEHAATSEHQELIDRYNRWRDAYLHAGQPAPNEPDWQDDRLYFRIGYPYPDWRAFIIDETECGYKVSSASTERSALATEAWKATFSQLEGAGKFIIATIADYLRIECNAQPIALRWRAEGLDPRVTKEELPDGLAKYYVSYDVGVYMISAARGIKPEHHVLPITYDDLNRILTDGLRGDIAQALSPST